MAVGVASGILIIKYNLPFGQSYLFSPWAGWIGNSGRWKPSLPPVRARARTYPNSFSQHELFLNKIREIAVQEKAIFWRYEPMVEDNADNLRQSNFVYAGSVEPKNTLLIDLEKSEEELLVAMHPKTRYNIRLAEKKGVKIDRYKSSAVQDFQFENFWRLIEETYSRQGVKVHVKDYYKKILEQEVFHLYLAQYQGKIIVANLLGFFGRTTPTTSTSTTPPTPPIRGETTTTLSSSPLIGGVGGVVDGINGTVTYLHGGSDKNFQNTMATNLIQWQAIKDAKAQGYKYYDFYGIAADGDKKNAWAGITRFKKGFNGIEKHYVGAWDFVFSKFWYFWYKVGRRLK